MKPESKAKNYRMRNEESGIGEFNTQSTGLQNRHLKGYYGEKHYLGLQK